MDYEIIFLLGLPAIAAIYFTGSFIRYIGYCEGWARGCQDADARYELLARTKK